MILTNQTQWSEKFLRRMLTWAARRVGCKVKWMRRAKFHYCRNGAEWGGRGGRYYIRVGVCRREFHYVNESKRTYGGIVIPDLADRLECLVATTAHECRHVQQFQTGRIAKLKKLKTHESDAMQAEIAALAEFRQNRAALLAAWGAEPAAPVVETLPLPAVVETPAPAKKSNVVERRAAKAAADLVRWERRLKMARTKVRKYKTRVRYYERKQSAASKGTK